MIYYPLQNKYTRWYDSIINKTQKRNWTRKSAGCYVEQHHIIPQSLGGSNDKTNKVFLTAREHYVCHWLLPKMLYGDAKDKMISAFWRFCNGNKKNKPIIKSHTYEKLRIENAIIVSKIHKGKILSKETKTKLRFSKLGKKLSPEHAEKSRIVNIGRKRSPESIEKTRQAHIGKPRSEETKEKIRLSLLGKKHPIERVLKNRETQRNLAKLKRGI
jgi:hypothetical protein